MSFMTLNLTKTFLQALQYLRKLCNHPSLVLTQQHPEYKRIIEQLAAQHSNLRDIQHAPKLSALKQVTLRGMIGKTASFLQWSFEYNVPSGLSNVQIVISWWLQDSWPTEETFYSSYSDFYSFCVWSVVAVGLWTRWRRRFWRRHWGCCGSASCANFLPAQEHVGHRRTRSTEAQTPNSHLPEAGRQCAGRPASLHRLQVTA